MLLSCNLSHFAFTVIPYMGHEQHHMVPMNQSSGPLLSSKVVECIYTIAKLVWTLKHCALIPFRCKN